MKSYSDSMQTAGNVNKSGSSQPYRSGGTDRNPGQGTGVVPNVTGNITPIIINTGATNNGGDNLPRRSGNR